MIILKNHYTFLLGLFIATVIIISCERQPTLTDSETSNPEQYSGPYLGQTPPGTTPELFAPGLISTGIHDDGSPVFAPDGKEIFFRKYAVPHDIVGYMKQDNGVWSKPVLFKPWGDFVFLPPCFFDSGKKAIMISRAPDTIDGLPADFNIWMADHGPEGFTNLHRLDGAVNSSEDDMGYSVSENGSIYLHGAYDSENYGQYDIYYSRQVDGVYQAPVNIGKAINTEFMERTPFVAPDESYILYCARGYKDSRGGDDLYVSFRLKDGSWSSGINLGDEVNTRFGEKFPWVSPDGKYIFYVSSQSSDRTFIYSDANYAELMKRNLSPLNGLGADIYWVSTDVLHRLIPEDK